MKNPAFWPRVAVDRRHNRRAVLYTLALALAAALAWTYFAHIDVAVRTSGIVKPAADAIRIVADVGGRVTRAPLREGDAVHVGDTIVQLDTREPMIRRAALLARIHFMETRPARARTAEFHAELSDLYWRLEEAQLDMDRLTITCPSDGRIAALAPLRMGETISAGMAIASISPSPEDLIIESWLPADDRRYVGPGSRVRLQSADGAGFDGVVATISPDVRMIQDSAAVYRVTISPSPEALPLQRGVSLRVNFITRRARLLALLLRRL